MNALCCVFFVLILFIIYSKPFVGRLTAIELSFWVLLLWIVLKGCLIVDFFPISIKFWQIQIIKRRRLKPTQINYYQPLAPCSPRVYSSNGAPRSLPPLGVNPICLKSAIVQERFFGMCFIFCWIGRNLSVGRSLTLCFLNKYIVTPTTRFDQKHISKIAYSIKSSMFWDFRPTESNF